MISPQTRPTSPATGLARLPRLSRVPRHLVSLLTLSLLAASAHAALITVTATGRIVLLSHPFTTQFAVGQTFTYTFTYESTATPTVQQGTIRTIPMQTAALTINGSPVWQNGPVTGLTLSVNNGSGTQTDRIAAFSAPAGPNVNGTGVYAGTYVPLSMGMELYAPSTRLTSTEIPTGFALSDWNPYALVAGSNVFLQLQPSGGGISTVRGEILTLTSTGGPIPGAPAITTQPTARTAVTGTSATFTVAASGTGNTYQWRKDNVDLTGATAATYTVAAVTAAQAGTYTVIVTNTAGSVTSSPAILTVAAPNTAGRLINLSVLTDLATATDEFTLGYVVGGAGTNGPKPLVIRAAGPSLGALGVGGTLSDPKLETFAGSTSTGVNDNWGGSAALTADLAAVGAFAYTGPTSRDSAVSANITTRDNSVKVTGVAGATGTVIAEVYDATPAANFATTTPRLLNVSVNKHLGTGLTAGFVLGGTTPTRVLIRVVGPGLAAFGVGGTVVDPQLALFNSSSVKIAENNDWAGTAELTAAFNSVGAFALPAATSKDAALLISLPPGGYSVQASGVNNTTGTALVEVYEVP